MIYMFVISVSFLCCHNFTVDTCRERRCIWMNRVMNGKVGVVNVCLGVQVGRSKRRNFESHEKNTETWFVLNALF